MQKTLTKIEFMNVIKKEQIRVPRRDRSTIAEQF